MVGSIPLPSSSSLDNVNIPMPKLHRESQLPMQLRLPPHFVNDIVQNFSSVLAEGICYLLECFTEFIGSLAGKSNKV